MMTARTTKNLGWRAVSLVVWVVCAVAAAVHGGCGGGTSGTGVKTIVVSGAVEGIPTSGGTVTLVGPDGGALASVEISSQGTYALSLDAGTVVSAVVVDVPGEDSIVAPLATQVIVEEPVTFTTTVTGGGAPTGETTVVRATPTPTAAQPTQPPGRSTATPTPTVNPTAYCDQFPNRPGCQTAVPTPTPTINPTAYCNQFPNRPGCAAPTPTPTINPTVYCAQFPNRPVCATPTPAP